MTHLIEHGHDVTVGDSQGVTALHLSVCNMHRDTTNMLLSSSGNAEWVSMQTRVSLYSALHFAAANDDGPTITALLAAGADTAARTDDDGTAMHWAAEDGCVNAIFALSGGRADVAAQARHGRTPMHLAAMNGHVDAIRALADVGGEVSARDSSGSTALHLAVQSDNLEATKALIAIGANVLDRNGAGHMPLHIAADWGHVVVLQALIEVGHADVSSIAYGSWTASLRSAQEPRRYNKGVVQRRC